MASEAPSALSRSAFSAVEVVAITRAPKTRANCSAKTETPPEPWIRTVSPAVTRRWPVSATQAVTAAQGGVAASSKDRWLGRSTTASSLKTADSASIPSRLAPSRCTRPSRSPRAARRNATRSRLRSGTAGLARFLPRLLRALLGRTSSGPALGRGGTVWSPVPYSPDTGYLYVPGSIRTSSFTRYRDTYKHGLRDAGGSQASPIGSPMSGTFTAIDSKTNKVVWQYQTPYSHGWRR